MTLEYAPGLKEYGMAIEIRSDCPRPTPEEITNAGRLVAFNFEMTCSEHPEFGLTNYRMVAGPSLEVLAYGGCPTCAGVGFLIGGNECWECDGTGQVVTGVAEPPRWRHNFGWYSTGPDGPPLMT